MPSAGSPTGSAEMQHRWAVAPVSWTRPAQSPPGGPGSPGYSPSTLSTSRKLSPTARTLSSTSDALSSAAKPGCASSFRFVIAPRPGSRSRTGPRRASGRGARRGTRAAVPARRGGSVLRRSATSGSAVRVLQEAPRARSAAVASEACTSESGNIGASCRAQRARPSRPAWRGAPPSGRAEETRRSREEGAAAMAVRMVSAACSIVRGARPGTAAVERTRRSAAPPAAREEAPAAS